VLGSNAQSTHYCDTLASTTHKPDHPRAQEKYSATSATTRADSHRADAHLTTRHQVVFLKTIAGKDDKYGRVLAQIYSDKDIKSEKTACLNLDIVSAGYAREYFGVGDKTWEEFK
jgi:hypothetical protein